MAAAIVLNIGVDKFVSAKIYLEFNWIWFLYIVDYQTKPAINLHPGGSPFANRGEAQGCLKTRLDCDFQQARKPPPDANRIVGLI